MFEEIVERGKEIQSVQHILINMRKDNNSLSENNMYICTLSDMFEEMVEMGKEIQSVQHILIHITLNNSSLLFSIFQTLQKLVEQLEACTCINGVYLI